jgi:hypothetical protein
LRFHFAIIAASPFSWYCRRRLFSSAAALFW